MRSGVFLIPALNAFAPSGTHFCLSCPVQQLQFPSLSSHSPELPLVQSLAYLPDPFL